MGQRKIIVAASAFGSPSVPTILPLSINGKKSDVAHKPVKVTNHSLDDITAI